MKKDIEFPVVEGIKITIARNRIEQHDIEWNVYLINRSKIDVENILITSRGYGFDKDGKPIKTSELRHFHEHCAAGQIIKIEMITPDVFHLNNEFWVSYYIGNQIFDKKFIFVPDSIREENLILIEQLNLEGILHE